MMKFYLRARSFENDVMPTYGNCGSVVDWSPLLTPHSMLAMAGRNVRGVDRVPVYGCILGIGHYGYPPIGAIDKA
jgi:hypothetical protein